MGIENNSDWSFKKLEEMRGNGKTLKRNSEDLEEILIGPSMALATPTEDNKELWLRERQKSRARLGLG